MKVRFLQSFDYVPSLERRVVIVFKPDGGPNNDGVYTVKRECGLTAIALGKARELPEEPAADATPEATDAN